MADKSWKAWERRVAKWFPDGRRRGADFRGDHSGKSDVISDGWSIEVKLLGRPTYGGMKDAARQAETNKEHPSDIPVAIVKKKGDPDKDALVVMRLESFSEYFINRK